MVTIIYVNQGGFAETQIQAASIEDALADFGSLYPNCEALEAFEE